MISSFRDNAFCDNLAAEHRTWLLGFDAGYLRNWENGLSSNEEAAFAEAWVRRLLQLYGITVEPNEDLTMKDRRPDFRCFSGDRKFYAEVTCIMIERATAKTGISMEATGEACPFRPLNKAVFSKCRQKAQRKQCADLDAPVLVAIGTFQGFAGMDLDDKDFVSSLLTGESKIAWNSDLRNGRPAAESFGMTDFDGAVFLHRDATGEVGYVRNSISGLLLWRVIEPPRVLGVLHPNPVRPFDPAILPQVEFGQVDIDWASRNMRVVWP